MKAGLDFGRMRRELPRIGPRRLAADNGTSLLEVLIVMAILALVAAVALPSLRAPDRAQSLTAVAADITGRLRAARATALAENRDVAFSFDAETRAYAVEGIGPPQQLPPAMDLAITTAREFARDARDARLLFFADGTSSGGTIKLSHAEQSVTISIAWLTSTIAIARGSP
jgi:general secretion pathway protein H